MFNKVCRLVLPKCRHFQDRAIFQCATHRVKVLLDLWTIYTLFVSQIMWHSVGINSVICTYSLQGSARDHVTISLDTWLQPYGWHQVLVSVHFVLCSRAVSSHPLTKGTFKLHTLSLRIIELIRLPLTDGLSFAVYETVAANWNRVLLSGADVVELNVNCIYVHLTTACLAMVW